MELILNYSCVLLSLFLIGSCQGPPEIELIDIPSGKMKQYILEFAEARETDLILMEIGKSQDSISILLYDLYSTCLLDIGDEFGFLVDNSWKNITAPMFKSKIGSTDVYIQTGIEAIHKSRSRYQSLLYELENRIDICVESYDNVEDSFSGNPPRTSTQMPWKIVINNSGTHMTTYTSQRDGYDDFHYKIEKVRIDSNYQEKYN